MAANGERPDCFAAGTLIRTARGEVAVEDLKVGDLAVTVTGEARPIVWLGHRRVEAPEIDALPIRIRAGAFGEELPSRDLRVSFGHGVCLTVVDEVFIPVGHLANGSTVAREAAEEITYWHVELESHDVLIAEGMPCESYLDCGDRGWFSGDEGLPDRERSPDSVASLARPLVTTGPIVEAIRQRLNARAEGLGWTRTRDSHLFLLADGERVEPDIDGVLARFIFPAATSEAVLVSSTFCPMKSGPTNDPRELGLSVTSLTLGDGLGEDRHIPLDHASLTEGFHDPEAAWRWTNGRAVVPAELWAGCRTYVILRVGFQANTQLRWIEPPEAETSST